MNKFESSVPEKTLSEEDLAREKENRILQGVRALQNNRPIRREGSVGAGGGIRLKREEYVEAQRRYDELKKEQGEQ